MKPFLIHLLAYLAVNAVLAFLNLAETVPEGQAREYWFQWPLFGWGIGVAAHGLALLFQRKARQGGIFADQDVQGVAVHVFVYIAVNLLLIAINLLETPETIWFIWPLLGWGLGLAAHAWLVYRSVVLRTVRHYAAEQEILSQMQLEKQAAEIAAAVGPPGKKKTPAKRTRRKQAAARTTKKAAARRGTATSKKKPTPKRAARKPRPSKK